jgi:hypothetical protein
MCNSTTTTATLTTHRLAFSSTSDDRATQRSCNTQQTNSLQARPVVTLRCRALTQQANSRNDERCCDGDEEGEGDEEKKQQQQEQEEGRRDGKKQSLFPPFSHPPTPPYRFVRYQSEPNYKRAGGRARERERLITAFVTSTYHCCCIIVVSGCCIRL